jgi:hypothetical protein
MAKTKTYKRELAIALLVFWGYVTLNTDPETTMAITPWVFLYTLGAFGLDAYSKQVKAEGNGVKIGQGEE